MSGPPEELMTREKKIFYVRHQNSPTYEHVTKLFLELEFQHKGNTQTKTELIVSKLLRVSRQEWIQKIKLFKCYTGNGKNKNCTDLSLIGQKPTFKRIKLAALLGTP